MQMDINLDSKHLYALTEVVIHRGTPHARHFHAYLKDFMKEGKYQKKEVKTTKIVCIVSHIMAVHRMRMMNECEMSLPPDLVEFVAEQMQIISSSCVCVNSDGKLTMNSSFIEPLLKKIIAKAQPSLDEEEMYRGEIDKIVSEYYAQNSHIIT
eukprot:677224_1